MSKQMSACISSMHDFKYAPILIYIDNTVSVLEVTQYDINPIILANVGATLPISRTISMILIQ